MRYNNQAPVHVAAKPGLKPDLEAISCLLEGETSTRALVQVTRTGWVGYGFGDTSRNDVGAVEGDFLFRYG